MDPAHTITPRIPVWAGFAGSTFAPARAGADIGRREAAHGRVPEGAVVLVRSDWSEAWPDPKLAALKELPGVTLDASKFLHGQGHDLCHGHEPLDTDSTLPRPGRPLHFDEASGRRVRQPGLRRRVAWRLPLDPGRGAAATQLQEPGKHG